MPTCTFFGHRDCPDTIKPRLREVLVDLIENHNMDMFYVGNQGHFDAIVRGVLRDCSMNTRRSITPWYWPTCPASKTSMTTSPTPCCRKVLNPSTHAMPSPGVTAGCLNNPTMSSPILPTPGAVLLSMRIELSKWLGPYSTYARNHFRRKVARIRATNRRFAYTNDRELYWLGFKRWMLFKM